MREVLSPLLPPSVVSVSGSERGASRTSAQSLLRRVVVEARQNQNAAFRFGSGGCGCGVTRGSLLLHRHDVLHQACDGSVNVGVVLVREVGGEGEIDRKLAETSSITITNR